MDTIPPNEKLSLKDLSAKLVMLTALCNDDRLSDLIALNLNFRQYTSAGVSFTIPGLTKTIRTGQPIQSTYPSFPEMLSSAQLRPYNIMKTELPHLGQRIQETTHYFYLTVKPFKPVGSTTIARWLKSSLQLAGINTTAFKAHSTRAAANSAAHVAGISVADIMKATDRKRESTFRRFYHNSI